jgi:hypothetical protein
LKVATPLAFVSRAGTSSPPLSTATKLSDACTLAAGVAPVVASKANSTSTVKENLFIFIFLSEIGRNANKPYIEIYGANGQSDCLPENLDLGLIGKNGFRFMG